MLAVQWGLPGVANAASMTDRVATASAYAASRGTTMGFAVMDRLTGEYQDNGAPAHRRFESASVVKAFVADNLLYRRDRGQISLSANDIAAISRMLRESDDPSMNRLWSTYGGNAMVSDVIARYGLRETGLTTNPRYWGNTLITAHDMVVYYLRLHNGAGGLSTGSRDWIIEQLRQSTSFGSDGYWQWFGLRDGLPGEGVIGQKQGWMCCVNGDIFRHSTGFIGPDARFIVVALAREPSARGGDHIQGSLTYALRQAYPEGSIPRDLTLVDRAWIRVGGGQGFYGQPTGPETAVVGGGGSYRWFQRGAVYWSPATGANAMNGAILQSWIRQGSERGGLGYPTTDEQRQPDGIGAANGFQRGVVFWSPWTDAHWLTGALLASWRGQGAERGFLGYPATDEQRLTDGGAAVRFQRGAAYWSSSTGAHWLTGSILNSWTAGGAERGPLGYPTTDEQRTADGIGAAVTFQRGGMFWSPSTGAHWLRGPVLDSWRAQGSERGFLGYPATDEQATPDGGVSVRFQRGVAYWSSSTGAHWLTGAILNSWNRQGAETGPLGYPTTDEQRTPDGGSVVEFEEGACYWSSATGAHWLTGPILDEWTDQGAQTGPLGYPVSDPYDVGDDTRVDFQGGSLVADSDGTVTTVP